MAPDEFKEKKTISVGLAVWAGLIIFNLGILYATMLFTKEQVANNAAAAESYVEQEVGGLRADWERQNSQEEKEREELRTEIHDLWEYHKQP